MIELTDRLSLFVYVNVRVLYTWVKVFWTLFRPTNNGYNMVCFRYPTKASLEIHVIAIN